MIEVDSAARATGFVEKGRSGGPGLVNAGLYVVDHDLIAPLALGKELDFGLDVLPAAIEEGKPIFAYTLASPVIDVGTPEALALAQRLREA